MLPLSKKSKSKYRIPASMRLSKPNYAALVDKVSALEAALKKANDDLTAARYDGAILETFLEGAREREAATLRVLNAVTAVLRRSTPLLVDLLYEGLNARNAQIARTQEDKRMRIKPQSAG